MEEKLNQSDFDDSSRKQQEIQDRLESIREELFKTRDSAVQTFKKNPLVAVGGVVALGILLSLVFRSRRRNQSLLEEDTQSWIDAYIDTIVSDARHAVTRGTEAGDAVREALQDRVPLIIYSPGEQSVSPGFIRQMLELSVTTAVGFAIRSGLERVTSRFERVATELERQTETLEGSEAVVPE